MSGQCSRCHSQKLRRRKFWVKENQKKYFIFKIIIYFIFKTKKKDIYAAHGLFPLKEAMDDRYNRAMDWFKRSVGEFFIDIMRDRTRR